MMKLDSDFEKKDDAHVVNAVSEPYNLIPFVECQLKAFMSNPFQSSLDHRALVKFSNHRIGYIE